MTEPVTRNEVVLWLSVGALSYLVGLMYWYRWPAILFRMADPFGWLPWTPK